LAVHFQIFKLAHFQIKKGARFRERL